MNSFMHCLALSAAATLAAGQQCASFPSGMDKNIAAVDNTGFSSCHGQLSLGGANDVQIVGENGELVQLMGISSHGLQWFPQCYTKDSIQFLVENWGINLFRAAMYVTEDGYSDGSPEVKDLLKDIVQWTKELGIYVIIDWHMLSPGNPSATEYSEAPAFWEEIAKEYKDEKHVIYEICNEPNGVQWSTIKQYADKIIPIIRNHDDNALIIVGTTDWSQGVDQVRANPVAKPDNVMYTFHFYAGTHMFLYDRIDTESKRVPIFATEWGVSESSGDGGPFLDNAKKFLDLFIDRNIAFSMWSYADKNEISAALTEDSCGTSSWDSVSCAGLFLKSYIKSKAKVCTGSPPVPPPTPVIPAPTPPPQQTPPPGPGPVPATPPPAACVADTLRCDGSVPCCSGECRKLYPNLGDHMCMEACVPSMWDCTVLGGGAPVPPPTNQCVTDTDKCDGSKPCCAGQCRRLFAGAADHMCMTSCSAPWDCTLFGGAPATPPPTNQCVAETEKCDGSKPCCAGQCRRLFAAAPDHMCMTSCAAPWDCTILGSGPPASPPPAPTCTKDMEQCAGPGECCSGFLCRRLSAGQPTVGMCMSSCAAPWDCTLIGVPMPASPPPAPLPPPSSCIADQQPCTAAGGCCTGKCYDIMANGQGMCMDSCAAPWSCNVLGAAPTCTADQHPCTAKGECCAGECYDIMANGKGMCMTTCGAPWSCDVIGESPPPANCAAGQEECSRTADCCGGLACFDIFMNNRGMCMTSCLPPFNCRELDGTTTLAPPVILPPPVTPSPRTWPPPTPRPPQVYTPRPANTPSGSCSEWASCMHDENCCVSGTSCRHQSVHYSQCRRDCPVGWACGAPATAPPPPLPSSCGANAVPQWGNCLTNHCCEGGFTCFEQTIYYAQCRQTCSLNGWSCKVFSP